MAKFPGQQEVQVSLPWTLEPEYDAGPEGEGEGEGENSGGKCTNRQQLRVRRRSSVAVAEATISVAEATISKVNHASALSNKASASFSVASTAFPRPTHVRGKYGASQIMSPPWVFALGTRERRRKFCDVGMARDELLSLNGEMSGLTSTILKAKNSSGDPPPHLSPPLFEHVRLSNIL